MPANSETILSNQTHPGDSTSVTTTGNAFKGDGFYGRSDGLHTIQYNYTGFIGDLIIQATLAIEPVETDWIEIYKDTIDNETKNETTNFIGNYVWIRAIISYTDGTMESVILNH
ncbi:uncharacterized protein METZ01_LOCUS441698 [marine metagenome]|uniref:Uncharacterized protein n=1 Tax=marine metagenome TaxID=408172 RepID=A0A382YZZ3_9ZZZZ